MEAKDGFMGFDFAGTYPEVITLSKSNRRIYIERRVTLWIATHPTCCKFRPLTHVRE
jgi:hypothetical protein